MINWISYRLKLMNSKRFYLNKMIPRSHRKHRTFHIRKRQRMFIKLYEKIRHPYSFGGYYFRNRYSHISKGWQFNDNYVIWEGRRMYYSLPK